MRAIATLLSLAALAGCARMERAADPVDHSWEAQPPIALQTPSESLNRPAANVQANGSLWVHGQSQSLFTDATARRLYDIVRIDVEENLSAVQEVDHTVESESELSYGIPNFLGFEQDISEWNDDAADPANLINASSINDYEHEGEQERVSRLVAQVSAHVVEVFPNGNMRLHGTQVVTIDRDDQLLTVEGIVRPIDVRPDNTVSSTRLASARITLTGKGTLAERQRSGWGARVLTWVWPF